MISIGPSLAAPARRRIISWQPVTTSAIVANPKHRMRSRQNMERYT
jgi:hypothetical protein